MAEKRQHRRFKKRYTVRFGTTDLTKSGITGDISKGGAFILTRDLIPLDTRVHLQVQLDAKNFVLFEGIVQRHRKVPPELRQMDPGGFGVRFLYPGEVVADIVNKDTTTFEPHYATVDLLRRRLRAGAADGRRVHLHGQAAAHPGQGRPRPVHRLRRSHGGAGGHGGAHHPAPGHQPRGRLRHVQRQEVAGGEPQALHGAQGLPGEAAAPQAEARRREAHRAKISDRSAAEPASVEEHAQLPTPPPLSPSASSTSLLLSLMIAAGPRPPTARCAASWAHCSWPPSAAHVPEAAVRQLQLHPALGPVAVARLEGGLGGVDVGDVRRVRVEVEVRVDGHLLGGHRREEARYGCA